jgi:hypothetical protein
MFYSPDLAQFIFASQKLRCVLCDLEVSIKSLKDLKKYIIFFAETFSTLVQFT